MKQSSKNSPLLELFLRLVVLIARIANHLDINQILLQDLIFLARQLDAKERKRWQQDRTALSLGYSDSRSLRVRASRIAKERGFSKKRVPKSTAELYDWVRKEFPGDLYLRTFKNLKNRDFVSSSELDTLIRLPRALREAFIQDSIAKGMLRVSEIENVYQIVHPSEVGELRARLSLDSRFGKLIGGSNDMI